MTDPLSLSEKTLRPWLKTFAERAPELLAIVLIVGMFIYHLGSVAGQSLIAVGEVRQSIQANTEALKALAIAIVVNTERSEAGLRDRSAEHKALQDNIDRLERR